MKAIEIVKQMMYNPDLAERTSLISIDGEESVGVQLDFAFGQSDVITDVLGEISEGEYVALYSEGGVFFPCSPDAVLVKENGMCIFLYKLVG